MMVQLGKGPRIAFVMVDRLSLERETWSEMVLTLPILRQRSVSGIEPTGKLKRYRDNCKEISCRFFDPVHQLLDPFLLLTTTSQQRHKSALRQVQGQKIPEAVKLASSTCGHSQEKTILAIEQQQNRGEVRFQ